MILNAKALRNGCLVPFFLLILLTILLAILWTIYMFFPYFLLIFLSPGLRRLQTNWFALCPWTLEEHRQPCLLKTWLGATAWPSPSDPWDTRWDHRWGSDTPRWRPTKCLQLQAARCLQQNRQFEAWHQPILSLRKNGKINNQKTTQVTTTVANKNSYWICTVRQRV